MEEATTSTIMAPIMQFGFAGFAAVLLCVLVWVVKTERSDKAATQKAMLEVVTNNTVAVTESAAATRETRKAVEDTAEIMVRLNENVVATNAAIAQRQIG